MTTGDLQHQRRPPCSLMDESPPLGSWNRLVTRSVLTSQASTAPSTLQEYTWLQAETVCWALENTVHFNPKTNKVATKAAAMWTVKWQENY